MLLAADSKGDNTAGGFLCQYTVILNAPWMTASSASAEYTPLKADFQAAGNDAALKYLAKVASCKLDYMKTNVDDLACLSEENHSIFSSAEE